MSVRRLPFEPLLAEVTRGWLPTTEQVYAGVERMPEGLIAEILGVTRKSIRRWRAEGVNERYAEKVAKALNLCDFEIWPELLEVEPPVDEDAETERRRRLRREQQRRYRAAHPERREKERAYRRAYYASAREYERRVRREHYWANRERLLEYKRRARKAS